MWLASRRVYPAHFFLNARQNSAMQSHPLRAGIFDELHSRPPLVLDQPTRLRTLVFFYEDDVGEQIRAFRRVCTAMGVVPPDDGRHYFCHRGEAQGLEWSLHTEFARFSFMAPLDSPDPRCPEWPWGWEDIFSGVLLVASEILVSRWEPSASAWLAWPEPHEQGLAPDAVLEADLVLHAADWAPEGATRYALDVRGRGWRHAGRWVQALVELETYLCLTLLALPIAKRQMRELDQFGLGVRALTRRAGEPSQRNAGLLKQVEDLAAVLEGHIAECQYRFSASRAYHRLVHERLDELVRAPVSGADSLRGLVERRLEPAMMTCDTVERRHEKLAARLQRTTALLRIRVDLAHEEHNRRLLAGMSHRAELQLRLQQTVEGLSVWVLSYYAVGLLAYLLKAGGHLGWIADPIVVVAALVPAFLIFFSWRVAQAHRSGRHRGDGDSISFKESMS